MSEFKTSLNWGMPTDLIVLNVYRTALYFVVKRGIWQSKPEKALGSLMPTYKLEEVCLSRTHTIKSLFIN